MHSLSCTFFLLAHPEYWEKKKAFHHMVSHGQTRQRDKSKKIEEKKIAARDGGKVKIIQKKERKNEGKKRKLAINWSTISQPQYGQC